MSIISRGSFPKGMRTDVKTWFGTFYNEYPLECEALFDKMSSDKNYEEDVLAPGFGLAPAKTEGASLSYDSTSQGYTNRSTHVTYGLGYIVTQEELEDNLYKKLTEGRTKALARSMRITKETVAANVYNRGFTAGFTFGDGSTLFATDHNTSAGDFSNTLAVAADLSEASLESACIQISGYADDRGLLIQAQPDLLIVSKENAFEAERILKSTLQNDTPNNAINALASKGMFRKGYTVNHFLTDTDAWFIKTDVDGAVQYQRRGLEVEQDNEFDTKNAKFSATERYSFTVYDPRSVFGSEGA